MFTRAVIAIACVAAATLEVRVQEAQPAPTLSSAVRGAAEQLVGGVIDYDVRQGNTLRTIGARFGVDVATLARENGMRTDSRLAVGQVLRVDNRHVVPTALASDELVVNVPQRMVFYRDASGSTVGYPIAVGRPSWPTPSAPFVVAVLERHPTWQVPRSILEESRRAGRIQAPVVKPGPNNPLGDFWIGLSINGIGIHATNAPSSIFRAVSHGCIRVHPDDIAQLFQRVTVGTPGRIIYEPVLLAVLDDAIYLEVHHDIYRRSIARPPDIARMLAAAAGASDRIDWVAADAVAAAVEGVARNVTASSPSQ